MFRAVILAVLLCMPLSAGAVMSKTDEVPLDLDDAKARLKAEDYAGALALLRPMERTVVHADLFNLIGFALRKSGKPAEGMEYYMRALDLDPYHKGALEYQGELFALQGNLARARANLDRLAAICPQGCEERDDLAAAIDKAAAGR